MAASNALKISKEQSQNIIDTIFDKVKRLIDQTLLPNIIEKVNNHEKVLMKGNGKPSLVTSMEIHNEKLTGIEKSLSGLDKFKNESIRSNQELKDKIQNLDKALDIGIKMVSKNLEEIKDTIESVKGTIKPIETWKQNISIKIGALALFCVAGGGLFVLIFDHWDFIRDFIHNIRVSK
jgi:hypothetical protein